MLLVDNLLLLHQLVLLLHRNLHMQGILHLIDDSVGSYLLRVHNFSHHFVINHHLVHILVKEIHLVGHGLEIEVAHLFGGYFGEGPERIDEGFVVFH